MITQLFMPMSLNTALFSTQNGVMPFEMNFPTFLISFAIIAVTVLTAWFVLSSWDVTGLIKQHIAGGSLLSSEDIFVNNNEWEMTTRSKKEGLPEEEDHERTAPKASDFQRVLVGIPLGRPLGDTSRGRSLRGLHRQRLSEFLKRGKDSNTASGSALADIEMGNMTSQTRPA